MSIGDLASKIPHLPPPGPTRLAALRQAVGDGTGPAALGLRRRPKQAIAQGLPSRAAPPRSGEPQDEREDATPENSAHLAPVEAMYFDHAWYARTYPQMAASGLDPVRHYLEVGCAEGCDPNPIFRSRDYLAANPDVAALGQNPFLHFVMYGQTERRRLKP